MTESARTGPETVEIAKQYEFFKRVQRSEEFHRIYVQFESVG